MAHYVPPKVYYLVFVTLIMLTLVTVEVAFYDLGILSFYVAFLIATTKATLVVMYFMHLKFSTPVVRVFGITALVGMALMLLFTFSDILTRNWLAPPGGW